MVQTRSRTKTGPAVEERPSKRVASQPPHGSVPPTKGKKRKSLSDKQQETEAGIEERQDRDIQTLSPTLKKVKKSDKLNYTPTKTSRKSQPKVTQSKPRLTTPDLEFDYDRSQLRDQRPTPGRVARPRYESLDIPPDLKAHLESTREIPKPAKPAGRLNAAQKENLSEDAIRLNPMAAFHDMYICHDKGRDGSPTYDTAGFQLDWNKVDRCLKPQTYNRQKMVRDMDDVLEDMEKEEKAIFALFFEKGHGCKIDLWSGDLLDYIKDQISKDLGVAWHQVGTKQAKIWRDKGFQPVRYKKWYKKPSEVEKDRMDRMSQGADFRKNL